MNIQSTQQCQKIQKTQTKMKMQEPRHLRRRREQVRLYRNIFIHEHGSFFNVLHGYSKFQILSFTN